MTFAFFFSFFAVFWQEVCYRSCTRTHTHTHARMFARTAIFRRVGTYALFMKESKHHASLQGLSVPQRGKMLKQLYDGLSAAARKGLEKRALETTFTRKAKVNRTRRSKPPRALTPYNKFVSANMPNYTGPVGQRMKLIAALWKQQK